MPLIFSAVLAGFWCSGPGAYASSLPASRPLVSSLPRVVLSTAISVAGAAWFCAVDRIPTPLFTIWNLIDFLLVKSVYFLPAFFFGLLFGSTIERAIRSWGRDVGWFGAWNTAGSCCGILLATLAGSNGSDLDASRARALAARVSPGSPAPWRQPSRAARIGLRRPRAVAFGLLAVVSRGRLLGPLAEGDGSTASSGVTG